MTRLTATFAPQGDASHSALITNRYKEFDVANLAVKTYLRKGKEKAAITWDYSVPTSIDSTVGTVEQRFGILLVFSSMEAVCSPSIDTQS